MRRSAVFGIKYFVLSILIFILYTLFLIHNSSVFAQTIDYRPYCQLIAADNNPASEYYPREFGPVSTYEPEWGELDDAKDISGESLKTTVTDSFQMIDVPGLAGRGGRLSSQSLLLPNAKEVADYLEGAYLDEDHRLKDLQTLKSQDFQTYFGTVVKLTPQKVQDRLKMSYIWALAVYGKRDPRPGIHSDPFDASNPYKLPDINFAYSDVCGQNPRTIPELLRNYLFPNPPSLQNNPTEADYERWRHTWGKYWPKIPLHDPGGAVSCNSFNPFDPEDQEVAACQRLYPEGTFGQPPNIMSQGCLVLRRFEARDGPEGPLPDCPQPNPPNILVIKLGVPDVFRLDTLARFTQQLLIPQKLFNLYICKFTEGRGFIGTDPADFCQDGETPEKLGKEAPNQGEQGVGGTPIKIYDPEISILGGGETVETIKIETKLPYLGLTFGKLTSALVGTFKFFDPLHAIPTDPLASWLAHEKYQQNSTKLPYIWSFTDTTIPVAGGHITEPPVWAGFLSGIKKSKNFVICSLLPSKQDAAACANENLQYNPVSR